VRNRCNLRNLRIVQATSEDQFESKLNVAAFFDRQTAVRYHTSLARDEIERAETRIRAVNIQV
jgi:hypothetical protein